MPGAGDPGHPEACVSRTLRVLNARPRPSRGGRSATPLDTMLDRAEDLVDRERFYEAACATLQRAVLGIGKPPRSPACRARGFLCTLEKYALITEPVEVPSASRIVKPRSSRQAFPSAVRWTSLPEPEVDLARRSLTARSKCALFWAFLGFRSGWPRPAKPEGVLAPLNELNGHNLNGMQHGKAVEE